MTSGAGDPLGVQNLSSVAIMPSLDKGSEGDACQGGIRRGNDDDEDVGDGVVACVGAGRKMLRWMGSSPLTTAGGRDPFSLIA